jgi:hypothetical protein
MKLKSLLFVMANLLLAFNLIAQEDIIVIDGGASKGGLLEATINGDTTATGERNNPNRIYELKADEFYLQHGPIIVNNPDGVVTIRGQQGGAKPVILKQPLNEVAIGQNEITSSLTFQNIQYENMETSNVVPWVAWAINGDNHSVIVEDCLIEFSQGIVFNAGNITKGAKIILRNNYFRDMNDFSQWWGARAAECKYAIDTLIIENNTFSGGGLTFLSQESLMDVAIINHNTFINNHKYPILDQYWRECYFTNNLFVNANMVGEDHENVATGGQDPDGLLMGIFGVDTIEATINIQPKYLNGDVLSEEVNELSDYTIYAADNVVTYSPTLDNYYNGTIDKAAIPDLPWSDAPASYLTWGGNPGPFKVVNVPGIWQNSRADALVADWPNIKEENNSIYEIDLADLGLGTDPLPQAAADVFIQWNRSGNQWAVPGVNAPSPEELSVYYFGDHNPQTVPGVETENSTTGGITKISDMIEDFSYTMDLTSKSDGMRIGALHWNDEAYDPQASLTAVKSAYAGAPSAVKPIKGESMFVYPNPVKNVLNIKGSKNADITIMNMDGRVVRSVRNVSSVNVSDLANGMYSVTIKEGNKISTQKVLISKN